MVIVHIVNELIGTELITLNWMILCYVDFTLIFKKGENEALLE